MSDQDDSLGQYPMVLRRRSPAMSAAHHSTILHKPCHLFLFKLKLRCASCTLLAMSQVPVAATFGAQHGAAFLPRHQSEAMHQAAASSLKPHKT